MLSTLRTKILRSGRVSNSTGLLLVLICFALASQGCAVQLAMLESKSLINPQIAQVPVQELKSIHAYLKQDYFEAMMYMDYAKAKQSIILINANKFQPTEVFEKNSKLTFYKFANKHYKQPIFIIKQDVKGVVSQTLDIIGNKLTPLVGKLSALL